jgi:hypothetical protein
MREIWSIVVFAYFSPYVYHLSIVQLTDWQRHAFGALMVFHAPDRKTADDHRITGDYPSTVGWNPSAGEATYVRQ